MEKRKILIADGAEDFCVSLTVALQGKYQVCCCQDGAKALQQLRTFVPDVLVVDLLLPGLDGITLMQRAAQCNIRPVVLATTRYVSDYALEAAGRLGVGYIMVKPCDIDAVAARIGDLSQRLKLPAIPKLDPESMVVNALLRLGVSPKLRGYGYLQECILQMANDPQQSVTKELYPEVAAVFGVSAMQVERSIRTAVQTAWSRQDRQVWQFYFVQDSAGGVPRPSNGEFISRLAHMLVINAARASGQ